MKTLICLRTFFIEIGTKGSVVKQGITDRSATLQNLFSNEGGRMSFLKAVVGPKT